MNITKEAVDRRVRLLKRKVNTYNKVTLTKEVLEERVKIRIKSKEHNEAFQKACFELGAVWAGSGRAYVLPMKAGEFIFVVGYIMTGELLMTWGTRESSKRRPDYRRIFFNVEENKDMEYEPFDLNRALAGEPVVTRDGREVSYVMRTRFSRKYPIIAVVVDGKVYSYTNQGKYYTEGRPSNYDLFMKPKTRIVNGFEVPAPVTNPDNMVIGDTYYRADISKPDWFFWTTWAEDESDMLWLNRGLVFLHKEDAIANAKAMVGINPYGD